MRSLIAFFRRHYYDLCSYTKNLNELLALCLQENWLSQNEKESIEAKQTGFDKNGEFYNLLGKREAKVETLEKLKFFLSNTGNEEMISILWRHGEGLSEIQGSDKIMFEVPLKNENFVGNSEIFQEIENKLITHGTKFSTLKIVLTGMGGVGKSSIATEFIYRNIEKYFDKIFWFRAEFELHLTSQLCKARNKYKLFDQVDYEIIGESMKKYFENSQKWLIVFDNVLELTDIFDYIPKNGGVVIITSRNRNDWTNMNQIEVSELKTSESIQLFEKIVGKDKCKDHERLIEILGNLPLALSLFSERIKDTKVQVHQCLSTFSKSPKLYLDGLVTHDQISILSCLKKTIDQIQKENSLFFEWLQICSYFEPDKKVPTVLLKKYIKYKKEMYRGKEDLTGMENVKLVNDLEKIIFKYGIVNYDSERNNYIIHPLIQKCVKLCIPAVIDTETVTTFLEKTGRRFQSKKKYKESIDCLTKCIKVKSEKFGPDNVSNIATIKLLGDIYYDCEEFSKASESFKMVLHIQEENNLDLKEISDTKETLSKIDLYLELQAKSVVEDINDKNNNIIENRKIEKHQGDPTNPTNYTETKRKELVKNQRTEFQLLENELKEKRRKIDELVQNQELTYRNQNVQRLFEEKLNFIQKAQRQLQRQYIRKAEAQLQSKHSRDLYKLTKAEKFEKSEIEKKFEKSFKEVNKNFNICKNSNAIQSMTNKEEKKITITNLKEDKNFKFKLLNEEKGTELEKLLQIHLDNREEVYRVQDLEMEKLKEKFAQEFKTFQAYQDSKSQFKH